MGKAKKIDDVPAAAAARAAKLAKKARREQRLAQLASKTFEQLSNADKALLLKALAVDAGLILDSDDA